MATLDELVAGLGTAQTGYGAIASPLSILPPVGVSQQPVSQESPSPFAALTESARSAGVEGAQPLLPALPENLKRLGNKWQELGPILAQLPERVRSSLVEYDSERVATGSQPLTREQTLMAALTMVKNEPTTKPADRNMLNIPGNAVGDLGQIVRSIPRIPAALVHEAYDLTNIGDRINEAKKAGANDIEALFQAPGFRMLPGAYIAGNISHPGELARHPLFTLLDILPAAKGLAAQTAVGKAAVEAAELTGKTANPLKAVLMRQLDESPGAALRAAQGGPAELVPNRFGTVVDRLATETGLGRNLSAVFGEASRNAMRQVEFHGARLSAIRDRVSQATTDVQRTFQESAALREKYGFTAEQVQDVTRRMARSEFSTMTPDELAFTHEARAIGHKYGHHLVSEDELGGVMVDGHYEFYTKEMAQSIHDVRHRAAASQRLVNLRGEMLNPTGAFDQPAMMNAWDEALKNPIDRLRGIELRAVAHAAEAQGWDTKLVRSALRKGDVAGAGTALRTMTNGGPVYNALDIIAELRKNRNHVQSNILAAAIADGNTTRITQALNNILAQTNSQPLFAADANFARSLRIIRDRISFDNSTMKVFTPKQTARYLRRADNLVTRNAPARFHTILGDTIRETMIQRIMPRGATADEIRNVTQAVTESRWEYLDDTYNLPGNLDAAQLYRGIENDVVRTWRDLANQGVDPVFVHRVPRSKATTVARPRIGPVPQTITQTKERALDMSPGVDDVTVALTHQGMEILSRQASEVFIDHIMQRDGIRESVLRETFAERAREVAARTGASFEQALTDILDRRFEKFNPDEKGYAWGGARLEKYRQEAHWIPKALAGNLRKMHNPKGVLGGIFDPTTKLFRMSVVGLSPRTQLYNILGGATMLMGQTGPSVWKYYGRARQLVKNPGLIEDELVRATVGSAKRSFTDDEFVRADATKSVLLGKTMARWVNESSPAGKVRQGFGKVLDKSLQFNAMFDDQYRVMAYLYGFDKKIAKGLSKDVAEQAGQELMRKSMMDWTGMTPIERTVFKSIFPFYGFMSHAVRYVLKYPVDHPLRASVLAAFARSEQEDLGALPSSFLGSMFIGDMSKEGDRNALNLAPINPFGDVANMFTVAGFLSATNPAIQTILEQSGLARGSAELYPTLRYDPESGRLAAVRDNPLMGFVENVIPQTQLVSSLLGVNQEFTNRMRRDPAGARRQLLSASGLPILWRQYNVPIEQTKAEVARERSQDLVRQAAIESGNWDEAMRYPGLRDYFAQLEQLPAEQLAQFTPPDKDALMEALQSYIQPANGIQTVGVPATSGSGLRAGGI